MTGLSSFLECRDLRNAYAGLPLGSAYIYINLSGTSMRLSVVFLRGCRALRDTPPRSRHHRAVSASPANSLTTCSNLILRVNV